MTYKIQLRRDTASNWTSENPILSNGEKGLETDTGREKNGDGITAWNSLGYISPPYNNIIAGDTIYGGTVVTNLDTINKNGFYTCYGIATGVPSASYSWFVTHQNSNVGTASATQRAVAYNSVPIIYDRVKTGSTWGEWTASGIGADQDLSNLTATGNAKLINSNVVDLGTVSSGTTTLTVDRMHKVTFSGAATIALPTGLTSGVHYNCSLLVTMSSVVTITQPTVTWAYGLTPTLTSTSVKYRLTYETIDGGTTWYGYWTQLGA